jgi:DNA polymerase I-like protein with 3'-5' exonuclease and polymerase domains
MEEYPHRFLGKTCNHAFNYEMGPVKFWRLVAKKADTTGVTLTQAEAKRMRDRHFRIYPELQWYWQDIRERIRANRTLINPFGRKRVFLGRMDSDTFREAYNHYAQSTVRDLIGDGMVAVHNGLILPVQAEFPHTRIALEYHDALLIQYPLGMEHEFFPQAMKLMTIPFEVNGREITIPVDCSYGPSWEGEGWQEYDPSSA